MNTNAQPTANQLSIIDSSILSVVQQSNQYHNRSIDAYIELPYLNINCVSQKDMRDDSK